MRMQTADQDDDWLGEEQQEVTSLLSGVRKCRTPDVSFGTPVSPISRTLEEKAEIHTSPAAYSERSVIITPSLTC